MSGGSNQAGRNSGHFGDGSGEGEVHLRTDHDGKRGSGGTALLFLRDAALCRWVSGSRRFEGN